MVLALEFVFLKENKDFINHKYLKKNQGRKILCILSLETALFSLTKAQAFYIIFVCYL